MRVTVRLFAIGREIVGDSEMNLTLESGATVQTVLDYLKHTFPKFQTLSSIVVAIGTEYAELSAPLNDGDELAIIPPVSGG